MHELLHAFAAATKGTKLTLGVWRLQQNVSASITVEQALPPLAGTPPANMLYAAAGTGFQPSLISGSEVVMSIASSGRLLSKAGIGWLVGLSLLVVPMQRSRAADQASSSIPDSRKLNNAPVPSAGCGKELGDFKSGTYTMTSAGLERKYTVDIPANYDKNKPHRLIFAMHMMGGNMDTMVTNRFYGLKDFAERDNVAVIFVAPQGYTDRSPWRMRDDKDHIFFADMLALFKDKLSVDTSRVFCCGFSFGAMVTYSLSLDFQQDLRAVACYAPANWNIYLPTNKHEPIAFYSTTGTGDGTCKWINSDARKQGGKYCVLTHLADNGIKELPEIPIATTPTHLTTEFKGCPEEYPVIFGSFVGGHTDNARDPESNVNWIAKETWDFFMRF